MSDPHKVAKDDLHRYLRSAREALEWKLEGLSEYDARRPLVRSGTNLLGLVKHVAGLEAGYLGVVFDNPFEEGPPGWAEGAEPNADMWATADESRADILALYRRVQEHCDTTIDVLGLGSSGQVPWWPDERSAVNLHAMLVHMIAETHRHAGHADILRELIDGSLGLSPDSPNLPDVDWSAHRDRLENVARASAAAAGEHPPA